MLKTTEKSTTCIEQHLQLPHKTKHIFKAIVFLLAFSMDCNSIIQCNSSSSQMKYDVFVSFRGEDTRNSFTDYLFGALVRKGIVAFRDDITLEKGKFISVELMQAIQASKVFIVVFSKNYANSTWCLEELAHIVDCIKVSGQTALPVFYDVTPSEVRKQSGDYAKALAEHEIRFKDDLEMVQRWREALTCVAGLSGFDLQNRPQHGETEKIIEKVASVLGYNFSSLSGNLVGLQFPLKQMQKLLVLASNDDVRVVGICGMGGVGKTTLARELYERIYHQYGAWCFIDDVSKLFGDYGPMEAQKNLLCQALKEKNQEIWNLSEATYLIRTRLRHIRTLIVLDNVDQAEQLEKMAVNRECLCAGSRIIIISRDEHILREYGVDAVYKVQPLKNDEALQLFCRKAFKCDVIMRGYENLTYEALRYAKGLPLAIKVLGSSLYDLDISQWISALARLKDNPDKNIMDVLQISFNGLEQTEKEIFLDIACFLHNNKEIYAKRVLDCCGFCPDIGLRVLNDKSLITTNHGCIEMHDMLIELGRKIVQEKAPNDPTKWSRLWLHNDFLNVMFENEVIGNLEAIKFKPRYYFNMPTLKAAALSKMRRLRLLILVNNENFSGSLDYLSNELRYLQWKKYPFPYLPSNFVPDKLVQLILPYSSIKQLWKGVKTLHNLRLLDLSHSENLNKTPDFRSIPNLEKLNLEGCTKLVEINSSIGILRKLVELNLKNCIGLMGLPFNIFGLSSLEVLHLYGCSKAFNKQMLRKGSYVKHLKNLDISETTMQGQTISSIHKRLMLPFHFFNFRRQKDLVGLLSPYLLNFPCVRDLDLSFCNLLQIPDAVGCLHCLERLNLGGNKFVSLPSSIKELPRLGTLNLQYCNELKYLFEDLSSNVLASRRELICGNYEPGFFIFNCPKLVEMESWSSMAISWMIQVIKVHQEFSLPCKKIHVVIPGTQIPRWFNNQSVHSWISIDDPFSFLNDSNCIGVAFCVAFATDIARDFPAYFTSGNDVYETKLSLFLYTSPVLDFHGSGNYTLCDLCIPIALMRNLIATELVHHYLIYFSREEFINFISPTIKYISRIGLRVFFPNHIEEVGLFFMEKNIGLRWIFKQDLDLELEELNPTMRNDLEVADDHSETESLLSNMVKSRYPIHELYRVG